MSDSLCQTFLVVFVQCIFGNPHSELILEAGLTSDPSFYVVGKAQFFKKKNQISSNHMSA